jgi:hypothetical protein
VFNIGKWVDCNKFYWIREHRKKNRSILENNELQFWTAQLKKYIYTYIYNCLEYLNDRNSYTEIPSLKYYGFVTAWDCSWENIHLFKNICCVSPLCLIKVIVKHKNLSLKLEMFGLKPYLCQSWGNIQTPSSVKDHLCDLALLVGAHSTEKGLLKTGRRLPPNSVLSLSSLFANRYLSTLCFKIDGTLTNSGAEAEFQICINLIIIFPI